MRQTLDEMDPWENPVVQFDFDGELSSVDSAMVTITPGGAELLDGAIQIVGTSVFQRIKSGAATDKTNYNIRCEAVGGIDRRVLVGVLPVRGS